MIALGGGALLDVAGLSAATYKRGMGLVYVPTTLLADVDASIGGKTAIDFEGVKNGIGTFYAPEEVLIAPAFLSTRLSISSADIVVKRMVCSSLNIFGAIGR